MAVKYGTPAYWRKTKNFKKKKKQALAKEKKRRYHAKVARPLIRAAVASANAQLASTKTQLDQATRTNNKYMRDNKDLRAQLRELQQTKQKLDRDLWVAKADSKHFKEELKLEHARRVRAGHEWAWRLREAVRIR